MNQNISNIFLMCLLLVSLAMIALIVVLQGFSIFSDLTPLSSFLNEDNKNVVLAGSIVVAVLSAVILFVSNAGDGGYR